MLRRTAETFFKYCTWCLQSIPFRLNVMKCVWTLSSLYTATVVHTTGCCRVKSAASYFEPKHKPCLLKKKLQSIGLVKLHYERPFWCRYSVCHWHHTVVSPCEHVRCVSKRAWATTYRYYSVIMHRCLIFLLWQVCTMVKWMCAWLPFWPCSYIIHFP